MAFLMKTQEKALMTLEEISLIYPLIVDLEDMSPRLQKQE